MYSFRFLISFYRKVNRALQLVAAVFKNFVPKDKRSTLLLTTC